MSLRWFACTGMVVLGLLKTVAVSAQNAPPAPRAAAPAGESEAAAPGRAPQAYGTAAVSFYTLPGLALIPFDSSTPYSNTFSARTMGGSGGFGAFSGPIILPAGAEIVSFEVDGCDFGATVGLNANLYKCVGSGQCTSLAFVTAALADVPGCTQWVDTTVSDATVDNDNFYYITEVDFTGTGGGMRVGAVRVGWRRQVSPAPGTATFADVPVSSPFHQFVEALLAAGITGGCGGGNYCPDSPVTRGQMAVFLAAALGLHWPN